MQINDLSIPTTDLLEIIVDFKNQMAVFNNMAM